MKDRILELLRQESGYLSGQEMSTPLGRLPCSSVESGGGSAERGVHH